MGSTKDSFINGLFCSLNTVLSFLYLTDLSICCIIGISKYILDKNLNYKKLLLYMTSLHKTLFYNYWRFNANLIRRLVKTFLLG